MKLSLDNLAVGVDIESISRFRNLSRKRDKIFLDRIFTKGELEYCYSKKEPARYLAVRFAGKEAVIKAMSSMGFKILPRNKIEILNDKQGAPHLRIIMAKLIKGRHFQISLSHVDKYALAFVVFLKNN